MTVIGAFRQQLHPDRGIAIAQGLILLNLVAMTRAFALVNVIELTLWLLFLFNKTLRQRFVESVKDPRIGLVMVFWAWIALSMLWSPAPWPERFDDWLSWRKLLLFPMAFSVFREDSAKRLVWWVLIGVAAGYMVMSWLGFLDVVTLDRAPQNLLENHATQGIIFATAALCAASLFAEPDQTLWKRIILAVLITGFVSNILMILTGRSSYVFLLICAMGVGYLVCPRDRAIAVVTAFVLAGTGLAVSDTARSRISQAIVEMQDAFTSEKYTSLGIRTVMWVNTIDVIKESPLLGSGAGGYSRMYAKVVETQSDWRGLVTNDPHQQYLHITAEYGLVALIIFLGAIGLIGCSRQSSAYVVVGLVVLAGTLVNGFANGHFATFVEGRLIWLMLGTMLASSVMVQPFARKAAIHVPA
ncbi:MAG: O-antigen ligase family protein [Litorivicinaceae bacterium]|nr:O-antigen ligase family protein [Litorivicinaceae bacterium]